MSALCAKVSAAVLVAVIAVAVVVFSQLDDLGAGKLLKWKIKEKVLRGGVAESAAGVTNAFKKVGSALSFGKPSADLHGLHISHLSTTEAKLIFHVKVTNPNPIAIPLTDVVYKVVINDKEFVKGSIPDAGTLGMHDSKIVDIGVDVVFKDVTDTFADLKPGSVVRYLMSATFLVDLPVIGRIEIPIDHDGDFPIPAIPDVDLDELDWVDLSFTETKAVAYVKLENLNAFTVSIKSFNYRLYLTDDLISEGTMEKPVGVEEKGVTRLTIPFTFRPKDLGRAVWDIISGSESGYKLEGTVTVDSRFGAIKLPFRKGGSTIFKKLKASFD